MQKYFLSHYENLKIPVDFGPDEIEQSRQLYEKLYYEQNANKVLGKDIQFDELSEEVKTAYTIYNYEYYRYMFEEAAKSFNIAYAYYTPLFINGEKLGVIGWVSP